MIKQELLDDKVREGTTTTTRYKCGHVFVKTTNPVIYDPAGVLCEIQIHEDTEQLCFLCTPFVLEVQSELH